MLPHTATLVVFLMAEVNDNDNTPMGTLTVTE